jgi:hypothetical protein
MGRKTSKTAVAGVPVEVMGNKNIKEMKDGLRELELKEVDLTRKRAFRAVAEGLEANVVVLNKYGQEVDLGPDHKVRLQASKDALEILRDSEGNVGKIFPTINLFTAGGVRIG